MTFKERIEEIKTELKRLNENDITFLLQAVEVMREPLEHVVNMTPRKADGTICYINHWAEAKCEEALSRLERLSE